MATMRIAKTRRIMVPAIIDCFSIIKYTTVKVPTVKMIRVLIVRAMSLIVLLLVLNCRKTVNIGKAMTPINPIISIHTFYLLEKEISR